MEYVNLGQTGLKISAFASAASHSGQNLSVQSHAVVGWP
jgi:hypothetical protein